jgi:hypothetical protein
MTTAKPVPEDYHTVTPYIPVQGADILIDFMKRVQGQMEHLIEKKILLLQDIKEDKTKGEEDIEEQKTNNTVF